MTQYRRNYRPGASWFFTVNLLDRKSNLLVERIDQLRESVRKVRAMHPFAIAAIVVLPDHLHAIWTLPDGDADYSLRWRLIKTTFSRELPRTERRSRSRISKGERGIWQRRFWGHQIRDEADLRHHLDYIHFNPVKHGHVARAADWRHSSIHRFSAHGDLDAGWAFEPLAIDVGERG